jgi:hypothetical protein
MADTKTNALATQPEGDTLHAIERALQAFPQDQFHWLVPAVIQDISPLMTPQGVAVKINPSVESGDVYPLPGGGGKLALHKVALDRIAGAVEATWVESRRTDDRKDPNYISWSAALEYTAPSGAKVSLPGNYDLDLSDEGAVFQDLYREQMAGGRRSQQEATQRARERLTQMRRRMTPLAESGAKNRAIRSLGIKSGYTAQELEKAFALVRFVPNTNDRDVKQAVLDRMRGRTREVYGERAATSPALPATTRGDDVQEGEFRSQDEDDEPAIPDVPAETKSVDVAAVAAKFQQRAKARGDHSQKASTDLLGSLAFAIADVFGIARTDKDAISAARKGVASFLFGASKVTELTAAQAGVVIEAAKDAEGQRDLASIADVIGVKPSLAAAAKDL